MNTLSVISISASAGVVGTVALLAAADAGMDNRFEVWLRRMRLSPAERAEYDELEQQIARTQQQRAAQAAAHKAKARAKFRADLVSTVSGRAIAELGEFTVSELVAEIVAAKQRLRAERAAQSFEPTAVANEHRAEIRAWADQLAALTEEFEIRADWRRKDVTPMERQRLRAGRDLIHDHSEWPVHTDPAIPGSAD